MMDRIFLGEQSVRHAVRHAYRMTDKQDIDIQKLDQYPGTSIIYKTLESNDIFVLCMCVFVGMYCKTSQ